MGRPPKKNLSPDLKEWLKVIGSNLTEIRESKEMSQAELARKAKVSHTTVNEIETRRFRDIRLSTLTSLARALGVSPMDLLGRSSLQMPRKDTARFLKASEEIERIIRKVRKQEE